MHIENNLTLITSILRTGKYILFSSDGIWGISCNAGNHIAVHELLEKSHNSGEFVAEILVSDLEMLKKFSTNLHPRVETLLVYHKRPLRIKCEADSTLKLGLNGHDTFFRIVKDAACRILISEFAHPIFTVSFLEKDNETQLQVGDIQMEKFDNIEFIASAPEYEKQDLIPLVKVSFNDEGLIEVLK